MAPIMACLGGCFEPLAHVGNPGPRYNSFNDKKKNGKRKAVICVAGLASSSIERKVPHCCFFKRWEVSYCSIRALASKPVNTLESLALKLVDTKLKDGTPVKGTATQEGVTMRPVPGTAGCRTLNPGELMPVSVWDDLIDELAIDYNAHAFNYDWRRWGDEAYAEELVQDFRKLVEKAVTKGKKGEKATLVGHSMGAPVILYIISTLGEDWQKQYIEKVNLVAPAHSGSNQMLPSYGHAPFLATMDFLPQHFGVHTIGALTGTWACMIAEMPVSVGGIEPWGKEYVFAETPKKKYKLADMGEFLSDLAAIDKSRNFGPALWPGFQKMAAAMKAPAVPTLIIYNSGFDTQASFKYDSEDLTTAPKTSTTEPGDGTICTAPVLAVAEAWKKEGAEVELAECPGQVTHKALIVSDFAACLIKRGLSMAGPLTPCKITIEKAEDIQKTDWLSDTDAYCAVEIAERSATRDCTKVQKNTLNPVWNEELTIYSYKEGEDLTFSLYDKDKLDCVDSDTSPKKKPFEKVTLKASQFKDGFSDKLALSKGFLFVKVNVDWSNVLQ